MMRIRVLCAGLCLAAVFQGRLFCAAEGPAVWTDKDQTKFQERLEKRTRKRLHFVAVALNLTPDQKAAVQKILDDRNAQIVAEEKEYRDKRVSIRNEARDKFLAVFNAEQRDVYQNGEGQKGGVRMHDQQPGRYRGGGLDEE